MRVKTFIYDCVFLSRIPQQKSRLIIAHQVTRKSACVGIDQADQKRKRFKKGEQSWIPNKTRVVFANIVTKK